MPKTIQDEAQVLNEACRIAKAFGMYVVVKEEVRNGLLVNMYLLCRRLPYGGHGTVLGKRNSPAGLLKLVNKCKEVK